MSQQPESAAPFPPEQLAEIVRTAKALQAAQQPGGPALPRPVREFGDAMTPGVALALVGRLSTVEAANARYESPETDLREGPWTQGKERQRQQLQLECQQLKQQVVLLEGEVQGLIRERAALVDDLLGPDSTTLEARLAKANSQVAELKQGLAEQERDRFRLILTLEAHSIPLPKDISPERAAPLEEAVPAAEPLDRQKVVEALADLLTPEGEQYEDPLTVRLYGVRMAVNGSVGIAAKNLGIYDELNAYYSGQPAAALPTTGEGAEPSPFVFEGHPNATQQQAIRQAAPGVGTIWQHRKRADEQVIICESTRWDSVAFRRHPAFSNSDFNRLRYKKGCYFLREYEPAPTTGEASSSRRQTVSNILAEDGTPLVFTEGNHWNE